MIQWEENRVFARRYKLLKLLGRGASSEVWMAEDTRADIRVALKIYAPGMGLDEDGVQLFSKEFALVFNMNHPNLLRPTHYDIEDRMPYLVMPYCEKGSTFKLIGKITEKEAWRFLHDVALGLAYLHGKEPPIIHQDIKPDNVLIDENGSFLITDFGISTKIRNTLHKNQDQGGNQFGGTIAYTGPERFSRSNRPVKASDIWALGASIYELLEGAAPFGYDLGGNLQKNGAEVPEIEGDWAPELKQIIERCLAKETWDRPTAHEIVCWTEKYPTEKNMDSNSRETTIATPTAESTKEKQTTTSDESIVHSNLAVKKLKIPYIAGLALILFFTAFWVVKFTAKPKEKAATPVVLPNIAVIPTDTTPELVLPVTVQPEEEISEKPKLVEVKPEIETQTTQESVDGYLREGNSNYHKGDYEAAIKNFSKCIELSNVPQEGAEDRKKESERCLAIKKNADLLFALQRYEEAMAEYRHIEKRSDTYVTEQIQRCRNQLER